MALLSSQCTTAGASSLNGLPAIPAGAPDLAERQRCASCRLPAQARASPGCRVLLQTCRALSLACNRCVAEGSRPPSGKRHAIIPILPCCSWLSGVGCRFGSRLRFSHKDMLLAEQIAEVACPHDEMYVPAVTTGLCMYSLCLCFVWEHLVAALPKHLPSPIIQTGHACILRGSADCPCNPATLR